MAAALGHFERPEKWHLGADYASTVSSPNRLMKLPGERRWMM
jgi:hypothetical protein